MYKTLLVATDGSKLSDKALAHAIGLAQAVGARLRRSMRRRTIRCRRSRRRRLRAGIAQGIREARGRGRAEDPRRRRNEGRGRRRQLQDRLCDRAAPWEAILAAAKKNKCDAIVMASHGRRGISAVLLGSETQKVLTHSKLPVIVVR